MSLFGMSPEEKKKILEKHKHATKNHYVQKEETKKEPQGHTDINKFSQMEESDALD